MSDGRPSPEPAFAPPGWPPPAGAGLNAMPHLLEGPYWVSFDRMHWWNGSAWMPGPPPAQPRSTFPPSGPNGAGVVAAIAGLIALALFALVAVGICSSMQQSAIPGAPMP